MMTSFGQVQFCGAYRINIRQVDDLNHISIQGAHQRQHPEQIKQKQIHYLSKLTRKPADEFRSCAIIRYPQEGLVLSGQESEAYHRLRQATYLDVHQATNIQSAYLHQQWAKATDVNHKPFRPIRWLVTAPFRFAFWLGTAPFKGLWNLLTWPFKKHGE